MIQLKTTTTDSTITDALLLEAFTENPELEKAVKQFERLMTRLPQNKKSVVGSRAAKGKSAGKGAPARHSALHPNHENGAAPSRDSRDGAGNEETWSGEPRHQAHDKEHPSEPSAVSGRNSTSYATTVGSRQPEGKTGPAWVFFQTATNTKPAHDQKKVESPNQGDYDTIRFHLSPTLPTTEQPEAISHKPPAAGTHPVETPLPSPLEVSEKQAGPNTAPHIQKQPIAAEMPHHSEITFDRQAKEKPGPDLTPKTGITVDKNTTITELKSADPTRPHIPDQIRVEVSAPQIPANQTGPRAVVASEWDDRLPLAAAPLRMPANPGQPETRPVTATSQLPDSTGQTITSVDPNQTLPMTITVEPSQPANPAENRVRTLPTDKSATGVQSIDPPASDNISSLPPGTKITPAIMFSSPTADAPLPGAAGPEIDSRPNVTTATHSPSIDPETGLPLVTAGSFLPRNIEPLTTKQPLTAAPILPEDNTIAVTLTLPTGNTMPAISILPANNTTMFTASAAVPAIQPLESISHPHLDDSNPTLPATASTHLHAPPVHPAQDKTSSSVRIPSFQQVMEPNQSHLSGKEMSPSMPVTKIPEAVSPAPNTEIAAAMHPKSPTTPPPMATHPNTPSQPASVPTPHAPSEPTQTIQALTAPIAATKSTRVAAPEVSETRAPEPGERPVTEQAPIGMKANLLEPWPLQTVGVGSNPTAPGPTTPELTRMVEHVVTQMLISEDITPGHGEVRLKLAENIMPDTEIRVIRHGNKLEIMLVTTSETSQAQLAAQKSQLQTYLNERLEEPVSVRLELENKDREENRGRSRGRRDYEEEDV